MLYYIGEHIFRVSNPNSIFQFVWDIISKADINGGLLNNVS